MLKEYKTMIILTLCCLTMVSIGFSSWVVTNPSATEDVVGSLEADSIIDNRKYVSKVSEEVFTYTEHGFIKNGYYSNTGNISIKYNINPKACVDYFLSLNDSCEGLYLEVEAKYTDGFAASYDIFSNGSLSLKYSVAGGDYVSDFVAATISNCTAKSKLELGSEHLSSTSIDITFMYTFTIPMGSTFRNTAYDKLLSKEGFGFAFSLILTNIGE